MAAAKARWRLLAKACISKPGRNGNPTPGKEEYQHPVSRAVGSFGFIKSRVIDEVIAQKLSGDSLLAAISLHHTVSYDVVKPDGQSVKILLRQRRAGCISLVDHQVSQACGVDSTGIVCLWPAEEVMTHYCTRHPELFSGRRILELGAGYGLAGLAVAACTEAREVVLTDGNPQVMDAIRHNIQLNAHLFGETAARAEPLTWGDDASVRTVGGPFDVIIAADCTFFKDYHVQLAETIKSLLTLESVPGASRVSTDGAEDPVEPQPAPSTSHASYPAADAAVTRDPVAPSTGEATLDGPEVTRASQSGEESAELERESDDLGTAGHGSEVTCRIGDVRTPVEQVGDESSRAYCMQHLATEIGKHKPSAPPKHIDSITADEPIALHFNPQRGGTLDKFVGVATRAGLRAELCESFDEELDRKVERLRGGSRAEWPGFTEEHCRPIMLILRP